VQPKTFLDSVKEWVPVLHSVLTMVLMGYILFGGDSTKLTEALKKADAAAGTAEQVLVKVAEVKQTADQVKATTDKVASDTGENRAVLHAVRTAVTLPTKQ